MIKLKFILTPVALLLAFQVYADETLHSDVVVVGAGAGGTVAAVSAVEKWPPKPFSLEKTAIQAGAGNFMEGSFRRGISLAEGKRHKNFTPIEAFNNMAQYHHWRINALCLRNSLTNPVKLFSGSTIMECIGREVKTAWRDKPEMTWHIYPKAAAHCLPP